VPRKDPVFDETGFCDVKTSLHRLGQALPVRLAARGCAGYSFQRPPPGIPFFTKRLVPEADVLLADELTKFGVEPLPDFLLGGNKRLRCSSRGSARQNVAKVGQAEAIRGAVCLL
jgi:hypothetical protein